MDIPPTNIRQRCEGISPYGSYLHYTLCLNPIIMMANIRKRNDITAFKANKMNWSSAIMNMAYLDRYTKTNAMSITVTRFLAPRCG